MDLTLDNVHRNGDTLTVFDFDSSGKCWRAIEPHGVMRYSMEFSRLVRRLSLSSTLQQR